LVRAPNTERFRASRNLDWTKDTGISAAKMVTVYHAVEENQHTYATVGFAGFSAALAGMRHHHHHHHHHHLSLLLPPRHECCWPHCQRGQLGQLSRNFRRNVMAVRCFCLSLIGTYLLFIFYFFHRRSTSVLQVSLARCSVKRRQPSRGNGGASLRALLFSHYSQNKTKHTISKYLQIKIHVNLSSRAKSYVISKQIWNRTDNTASNNFLISSANEGG
jgi:hypothetical protein